jgi:hypothetical protein
MDKPQGLMTHLMMPKSAMCFGGFRVAPRGFADACLKPSSPSARPAEICLSVLTRRRCMGPWRPTNVASSAMPVARAFYVVQTSLLNVYTNTQVHHACMVPGTWCMMRGTWCMEADMVNGAWKQFTYGHMVHAWCMDTHQHGNTYIWCMVHGHTHGAWKHTRSPCMVAWCMVHAWCVRATSHGTWKHTWRMHGACHMVYADGMYDGNTHVRCMVHGTGV